MSLSNLAEARGAAVPFPLYRAVWRWHFYAGLLVIPVMILLAVTGGIYLLKDELNSVFYKDYLIVAPQDGQRLSASEIVAKATDSAAGTVTAYFPPARTDASAAVTIKTEAGKQRVYVNP